MRKVFLCLVWVVLPFVCSFVCRGQTVFSYAVDTLYVSAGDSTTVVGGGGHVFSVGDSVSGWFWMGSDDSVRWNSLPVVGDSALLDTLPVWKYYCAVVQGSSVVDMIVWRVDNVVYKSLLTPVVWDDMGINKESILLLKLDSIRLFAAFSDLQPDTVVWYRETYSRWVTVECVSMPVGSNGLYYAVGYLYSRQGRVIDSCYSSVYDIQFKQPLDMIVFRSWAGSNDGRPRRVDTLVVDTCKREMVIDTLWFEYGNPYRYQFVPIITSYSKSYDFTYRWVYDGFAAVIQRDSILEFDPLRAEHSGSYVFVVTRWVNGRAVMQYGARPVVITARARDPVGNFLIGDYELGNYVVYGVTGAVVLSGSSGRYGDVVRDSRLPSGIYFLRYKDNRTVKFFKY